MDYDGSTGLFVDVATVTTVVAMCVLYPFRLGGIADMKRAKES